MVIKTSIKAFWYTKTISFYYIPKINFPNQLMLLFLRKNNSVIVLGYRGKDF